MKFRKLIRLAVSSLSLVSLLFVNSGLAGAAGSATFSLSPSSGSHIKGTSFTVSIYENSGTEPVNAVQANLKYDSTYLQYLSIDASGSAFGVSAMGSGGGGKVSIARGNISPVTGNKLVAKVSFKALKGSGSTAITFASDSAIVKSSDSTDIWNHNASGGTYTLKTATTTQPTPKPSGGGTTKPSTSGSGNTSGAGSGTVAPSPSKQKSEPTNPVPASKNTQENATFFVAIKVVDSKGKPVGNATVTLGSNTATTDNTGIASFVGIAAGTYEVTVKSGKVLGKSTITVDGSKLASEVQQFEIKAKDKFNWNLILGIGTIILAILVIMGLWRGGMSSHIRRISNKHHGLDGSAPQPPAPKTTPSPTVISSNGQPVPTAKIDNDNIVKPTIISPNGNSN